MGRGPGANQRPLANLEQKHPVSLLGELSSKRKWGAPAYDLVNIFYISISLFCDEFFMFITCVITYFVHFYSKIHESGPAHAKNFVFKVIYI